MIARWYQVRYKWKVFFCILISTAIPILILGLYSYHTYRSGMDNEVNSSVESSLQQLTLRMDSTMNYIRKYYIEMSEKEEIKWLMNTDINYSDYSLLVKAQDTLSGPVNLSEYINGYTFVNWDTGWVLSNRGMYPYDRVINKDLVEILKDGTSNWFNQLEYSIKNNLRREEVNLQKVVYYQNLPVAAKQKNALLIVNVDFDKINQSVLAENENCEIIILDGNGKLVYGANTQFAQYLTENYQKIKEKKSGIIGNVKFDKNVAYRIGVMESESVDWTYCVGWNTRVTEQGALSIVMMTGVVFIGCVLFMLLIMKITKVIYQPVANLREYVDGMVSQETHVEEEYIAYEDDFKCISGGIECLMDNHHELEKKFEAQKAQLSEFFLMRLINGTLNIGQIKMYFFNLGIKPGTYYAVMAISIQSLMEEEYDQVKLDALRFEVLESIPEEIKARLTMEPSINARVITLVISDQQVIDVDRTIIEVYKGFDIYVQIKHNFPVKVGVSSTHTEWKQFRIAHNEAIEALKNNEVLQKESQSMDFEGVMFYSDIDSAKATIVYDRLVEKEVKEAVDNCDLTRAYEHVDAFLQHLIKYNVPELERKFCVAHFMNEILLVAVDAGLSVDEIFHGNPNDIFQSIYQIYDLKKLGNFYKYSLIQPIINKLSDYRTSKSSQVITDILALIEEEKGDITLSECADRLKYHTTYIWKVMKIEKNTTFSDYVAKYKAEEAKSLLNNTNMTVNEIAAKLNYTNAQNFIRFFSRVEGITPGKYRAMNKR